jgi:hypothetical protein
LVTSTEVLDATMLRSEWILAMAVSGSSSEEVPSVLGASATAWSTEVKHLDAHVAACSVHSSVCSMHTAPIRRAIELWSGTSPSTSVLRRILRLQPFVGVEA